MDLEQLEAFALGDREAALAQLVPGTEDHDYHRALLLQERGKLAEVDALLDDWLTRHGYSERRQRIERRQLLYKLGLLDQVALDQVRDELGVELDHQADLDSERPRHPTRLADDAVDPARLIDHASNRDSDLRGVTDEGLPALLDAELDATRLRHLLTRLGWTPHRRIVELIAADLGDKSTRGFGSLAIHTKLTTEQLDALARLRPELRVHPTWVDAVLIRLRPAPHVDWQGDPAARAAYLEVLVGFVRTLPPAFNSLRAHVLWHRLDHDRRNGRHDRDRFVEYLQVPRHVGYARTRWLESVHRDAVAQVGRDHTAATGLAAVTDEEGLVRDYLHRFLVTEDGRAFADWLDAHWLQRELATARLLAGDPEVERWTTLLGPADAAALRDRVDLDLALDNPVRLAATDPVALRLDVKHVPVLTVKVFRIDQLAHFLAHGREVTTAIDLDGLTGGFEATLRFDAPPMHRVRRTIELPACGQPGTYVVEMIGNGKSSRALIRKGRLRHATRIGAAGLVVTIADDAGGPVDAAAVWLNGREYRAEADGTITLPFSKPPGRVPMLVVGNGVAMLEQVEVPSEHYTLEAMFSVERESLAAGGTGRALLRTRLLLLAGVAVPIALLEDARVEIATTDGQGTTSTREQPVVLADDKEVVVEWTMPADVASIGFTLRGKVRSVSEQRDVQLSQGTTIEVATIHRTDETEALYLAATPTGWVVSVLGKTGEPRPRRQVNITLRHRVVTDEITATLDTDDRGRVELGRLPGITSIAAATATTSQTWPLWAKPVHVARIRVIEGAPAVTPLARDRDGDTALVQSTLVELRGGVPARDVTRHLRAEPGGIAAVGLAAGEYALKIPGSPEIYISVIPPGTPVVAGWAALPITMSQLSPRRARLGACAVTQDHVRIEVLDPGPHTRVHVVATRFAPAQAGHELRVSTLPPHFRNDPAIESQYVSGRDLGDEYRYVLERRTSKRRPGLLLERPGLLLNPWAVRATSTAIATAATGSAYAARAARQAAPAPMQSVGYGGGGSAQDMSAFPTHDFVPRPPVVLANLRPDASGIVTIDRAALAGLGSITIICVDPGTTTNRWVALPEVTEPAKDLRLRAGLDPERHVIEKKDVIGLAAGDALTVDDLATARAEVVDTIGKAHRYLLSLNDDATLRELSFLATWDKLPEAERRTKYSKYACHELHLFLYFKDPAFFAAVIRPYLANKQPRTFVDRWLLGEDLAPYVELWRIGRLNVVERCLLLGTLTGPVADAVQRLIGDAVDLIPPDPERDGALVDALLGSSALSTEGGEIADAFKAARPADAVLADEKLDRLSLAEEQSEADDDEHEGEVTRRSMRARDAAPMKKMKAGGRGGPGGPPPPPSAAPLTIASNAESTLERAASSDAPVSGDLRRREQVTQLYRGADLTQEWAENNWWHTRPAEPGPDLITANKFWRDFAAHRAAGGKGPFLSPHLGLCTGSFAEMMCALAVIDLPFTAGAHAITTTDGRMTLRAASHALVARRQLAEVTPTEGQPILIGQNLVRADDRYDWDGAEQREKYVTGELLAGVVYTGLVAVTNPTSAPARVDLLIQIPRGSLPVGGGVATRTVHLQLEAYGTATQEYSFYFPLPGRFVHYPAHVARKGELLQWAQASTYEVVREPTEVDPTSWRHLSQRGTLDQVAGFLATANLGRIELERIAWRMKDRAWFDRITAAIAARGAFASDLWAYALRHKDARRLREWLEHQDQWLRVAGRFDRGPVAVDEAERGWHEHLEYAPLINARAHRLGARARILNDGLATQYRDALEWIALRPASARDHARAAHYLFTQDRLDEALALVERIDRGSAGSELQLDYLLAYGACARGDLPAARRLAARWAEHPVDRWRHRFAALIAMLDEAEGTIVAPAPGTVDPDSRDQRMAELASRQPAFELAVDREGVIVDHRNLPGIELRFHRMELELLFSRQPFVQSDTARFSFVDPGRLERLVFAADGRTRLPWPPGMGTGSVVVEAVAVGVRKAVAHYAHDLLVTVAHQYGQLRVARASDHAVLPATYVKVFGRQHGGAVAFYKDGYTDLRGRFDYATLSTDDLTRVERFAILVASDDAGALVVEAGPPAR